MLTFGSLFRFGSLVVFFSIDTSVDNYRAWVF